MASGNQTVSASSGKWMTSVTVNKPATLLPENIKKDVNIGGVVGTMEAPSLPDAETALFGPPPMPVKGDLITMNLGAATPYAGIADTYRILSINGNVAEVVAMFDARQIAFNANASCFLTGTKITMADGSTKNVEDLTYADELKVWDFDTGNYGTAKVCWLTQDGLTNDHYYQLTFSDGTVLKTTGKNSNHKVYNVDERFFKGVDKTEIGDRIFSENGIVTVMDKQYIEEEVAYYNVITSKKFDCFANGILTADRYGNTYTIDENMMWVKGGREIRPYSEFEAVGISGYWYENFRLGEQTESMESTIDYIAKCEAQMKPIEEVM